MSLANFVKRSISFQDVFDQGIDLDLFHHPRDHAGVRVTEQTAASLSAVYACWRIISEAIATLPRDVITTVNGVPTPLSSQPIWMRNPNPDDTWTEFLGQVMVSLLATGNAYILVRWGFGNAVADLTVLDPHLCTKERRGVVKVTNSERGTVTELFEASSYGGDTRALLEVLHVRGMTKPGALEGMNPIQSTAQTLGVAIAAQKYGAEFFANDATPSGLIQMPESVGLSPDGQAAARKAWNDLFGAGGKGMRKRVGVLIEGARFQQLQISPNEAQFLETRKFGVQEVARIYGAPPHLIGDTTNTTGWGTGMAEQNTAFVIHTLRPWIERLEARLSILTSIDLKNPQARLRLNEEALLRGATKERWEVLRSNVAAGLMTADEARRQEGMAALPDGAGSVPWVPLNQAQPSEGGN